MIRAKFLSRPALGIALALATLAGAGLVASPAIAAEKQKAPAPLKLKLSKDFQAASNAVLVGWQATKKRPDVVAKEAEMKAAAKELEFEKAALLRDQILELRQQIMDIDDKTPQWEKIRKLGDLAEEAEDGKPAKNGANGKSDEPVVYKKPMKGKPGKARERTRKSGKY